jgi:hypothetical protein
MALPKSKRFELQRNHVGDCEPAGDNLQAALWRAHDIVIEEPDVEMVAVYQVPGPSRLYLGVVGKDGRLRRWINRRGS